MRYELEKDRKGTVESDIFNIDYDPEQKMINIESYFFKTIFRIFVSDFHLKLEIIDEGYDALLRPRQAVTQNGSTSSTLLVKRDSLGQPREVQATREDGAQETTLYYYNADISLDRVQQPDGKVLDLGYDKLLRVTSLVRPTGSAQTMTQTYGYDQASQLTSTALGTYATAAYGYNKDGQLRMIKRNNKTVTIYAYATDGRLSIRFCFRSYPRCGINTEMRRHPRTHRRDNSGNPGHPDTTGPPRPVPNPHPHPSRPPDSGWIAGCRSPTHRRERATRPRETPGRKAA